MSHSGVALLDPRPVFEKIALKEGMRVADLGCGRTGHFVFPASRVVKNTGIVYAVDIIKNVVESIKSRVRSEGYDNVQVLWGDIEKTGALPIPADSLDVCFMINVLFLTKDKAAVVEEAARLLHSGGYAVVIDWQRMLGPLGPQEGHFVDANDLKAVTEKVGLSPVDFFSLNDYHYCLIVQKP